MLASSPYSSYGVLRRPFIRILLFILVLVMLFLALLPDSDTWQNITLTPPQHQHQQPTYPEQPSRNRIKVQRPLAKPAHDGPWAERADAVRGAFMHAYEGYLTHAARHDELLPLTKSPVDKCVCPLPRLASAPLIDSMPCAVSTVGVLLLSILLTRCGSWACTMSLMTHSLSWPT